MQLAPGLSNHKNLLKYVGLALVILVPLVTTVFLIVFPLKSQMDDLQGKVASEQQMQQMLERTVSRLPELEKKEAELTELLAEHQGKVPGQADFPLVVAYLNQLVDEHELTVVQSSHGGLQHNSTGAFHAIHWELRGAYHNLVAFTNHILESFPSLTITDYTLSSRDLEELGLRLGALLYVSEEEAMANWNSPMIERGEDIAKLSSPFGVPTSTLQQFMANLQVLGVVATGDRAYALVRMDQKERWYQVGEALGQAQITGITKEGITLYYGGVNLKLGIGVIE